MALFFLVRVELHGSPGPQVYDRVHQVLGSNGFAPTVVSGDNRTFLLPNSEYVYYNADSAQIVAELANRLLGTIWADCEVFASEVNSWWAIGVRQQ